MGFCNSCPRWQVNIYLSVWFSSATALTSQPASRVHTVQAALLRKLLREMQGVGCGCQMAMYLSPSHPLVLLHHVASTVSFRGKLILSPASTQESFHFTL